MANLPLNDEEIDKLGALFHAVYSWATDKKGNAADILPLKKQYEEAVPLMLRGNVPIDAVIQNLEERSPAMKLLGTSFQTADRQLHEPGSGDIYSDLHDANIFDPQKFASGLQIFQHQRKNLPPEDASAVTPDDMRRIVRSAVSNTAAERDKRFEEDRNPLIAGFKDLHIEINSAVLGYMPRENYDVLQSSDLKTAVHNFTAAVAAESKKSQLYPPSTLETYLKNRYAESGFGELKVMPSPEALKRVDAVLAEKGVSTAGRVALIDRLREVARDAGADIDRGAAGRGSRKS